MQPGRTLLHLIVALLLSSCHGRATRTPPGEVSRSCEAEQRDLIALMDRLPSRGLAISVEVTLPESSLVGPLRHGPVLEVSENAIKVDGQSLAGQTERDRIAALRALLPSLLRRSPEGEPELPSEQSRPPTLYVATDRDLSVRAVKRALAAVPEGVEVRLLFWAPRAILAGEAEQPAHGFARQLLSERDFRRRQELARAGFAAFSRCVAVNRAVASVEGIGPEERWPRLQIALREALASCSCDSIDASSLKHLLLAEQRAGSMAFGSVPLSFLRDARCGASMPLRSMQKLLTQMGDFEAEYSGDWQQDALRFEEVITDERLLNYFCDALPGETLAELQRSSALVYWRAAQTESCEGWRFEPLSLGAPMGTWRRESSGGPGEPLTFHYWQGAEEISLFGPAAPGSKPTDERSWPCRQNLKMTGIDAEGIDLERGRWFFTETGCRQTPEPTTVVPGCVSQWATREETAEPSGAPAAPAAVPRAAPAPE